MTSGPFVDPEEYYYVEDVPHVMYFAAGGYAIQESADRFVTDGPLWTSGGASPTFDMMLHLVREQFGSAVALDVASVFVYDEVHSATDAQPLVSLGRLGERAALKRRVKVGAGAVIEPFAVLFANASVGAGATIESGARIGRWATVSPGAVVPAGTTVPPGTVFP